MQDLCIVLVDHLQKKAKKEYKDSKEQETWDMSTITN